MVLIAPRLLHSRPTGTRMSAIKAALKLFLLVLWSLLLVPVQLLVMLFTKGRLAFRITGPAGRRRPYGY